MSDDIVKQEIVQTYAEPFSIELDKGKKGEYGYTIKVRCKTGKEAIQEIIALDTTMKKYISGDFDEEEKKVLSTTL